MEIDQIFDILVTNKRSLTRNALQNAILQKNDIIPYLIKNIEYLCKNHNKIDDDDANNHICFYSLLLLSQFHCHESHETICQLMKIPYNKKNDYLGMILGDLITEGLEQILANTYNGDINHIKSIVECDKAYIFVRGAALQSLTILAIRDTIPRNIVIEYFKSLLEKRSSERDILLWNGIIINECYNLCAIELLPLIEQKFKKNMVDKIFIQFEKNMETDQCWIDRNINCSDNIIEILESWPYIFDKNNKKA